MATTRAWSATEMFTGSPKSFATDMYDFGLFMWELETCELPIDGVPLDLIDLQVIRGVLPHIPSPLPEGFPPAHVDVVQHCWHHDPQGIPQPIVAHRHNSSSQRANAAIRRCAIRTPASLRHCILAAIVVVTVFRGLDVPLTQLSHLYFKGSTVWLNAGAFTTTDKAGTLLQIIALRAYMHSAVLPKP